MEAAERPRFCLLLHNVTKPRNCGMILRSAAAFNVSKVALVSRDGGARRKSKTLARFGLLFGDKGCANKLSYEVHFSLAEAKKSFVERGLRVCGVEIVEGALPVHEHPFRGDTVFVLGNEGEGLIAPVKQICDEFVFIPQYTAATASLNVAVSASIVFHHFALWAGYAPARVEGEKFARESGGGAPPRPTFEVMQRADDPPPAEEDEVGVGSLFE